MAERLDKVLSSQNVGSRKEIASLAKQGRITVNGAVVKKADHKVIPEEDIIAVDGKLVSFQRYVYYMMHKPGGVLSAARDSRAETVVDLLPPELVRRNLFPAGRLDKDTEGLLILTDDGDFAHRMLSPKKQIWKEYHARLDHPVDESDIEAFAKGVPLSDFTCLPAKLEILETGDTPLVSVEICEGKFHQVKRMFLARGCTVTYLKRVRIGKLSLDSQLLKGQVRPMTEEELALIFA
jgi:16S rRNA pseudouridine516 synthase